MLVNFPTYMRSKSSEMSTVLQEMSYARFRKPQGRPKYSASMIRYALLHRFTSCQANKIMLEQLSLPSLSLFEFNLFREEIKAPEGYISWNTLDTIYEKDERLLGNLRK